jgi:hypothetical protein
MIKSQMTPYVALALLLLMLLVGGTGAYLGYDYGQKSANEDLADKIATLEREKEEHLAADAAANHAAEVNMRRLERDLTLALDSASQSYEKGKKDAEAAAARVVADLRNGNLRLQDRWRGCEARSQALDAASLAESEAAARDREESASRIVQAAAQCDAQVNGLIEAYDSAMEIMNKR